MTTIRQELVTCALCGEQTLVTQLDSTSSFGPPDLDVRPAEPARSSIFAWVQRCASCGANDREIAEALQRLVAYGERRDYCGKFVILDVDEARNYYVQFAVDEGGLFCEVVHNKYLAPEHAFTGDDVAKLLALGFEGPEHDDQNLFRVFRPTSEDDYMAIVTLARTVVTDFFGLPPGSPLQLQTSWESHSREMLEGDRWSR